MLHLEIAATNCWLPRANDSGRRTVPVNGSSIDNHAGIDQFSDVNHEDLRRKSVST